MNANIDHVFISGGATGIGESTVSLLAAQGVKVSFLDLKEEEGKKLVQEFGEDRVFFFHGNASGAADMQNAVSFALEKFGPIQGAFSCAGIHASGNVLSCSEEDFDRVINANLRSAFLCVKTCLPYLIENGGGSMVMMGSDQSFVGKPGSYLYGMTKGAIAQMTKSLAIDYAKHNVRVNAVCPGTIVTPMSQGAVKRWADHDFDGDVQAAWAEEAKFFPLGRVGQADEVAKAVRFLLGSDSSYMTGECMKIDGGYTAGSVVVSVPEFPKGLKGADKSSPNTGDKR